MGFVFRWYEELKVQYEQEKMKLKENLEIQVKQIEELEKKVSHNLKEKEEFENTIKQLEKQIKFVYFNFFLIFKKI